MIKKICSERKQHAAMMVDRVARSCGTKFLLTIQGCQRLTLSRRGRGWPTRPPRRGVGGLDLSTGDPIDEVENIARTSSGTCSWKALRNLTPTFCIMGEVDKNPTRRTSQGCP